MYTIDEINAMSPEEFDKLDPSVFDDTDLDDDESEEDDEEITDDNPQGEGDDDLALDEDDEEVDSESEVDNDNDDDGAGDDTDTDDLEQEEEEALPAKTKGKAVKGKEAATPKGEEEQVVEVDHADFYSRVTQEFKANGGNYSITSPEDIVSLMQKGLNYNMKMNAIKPYAGVGKILEENDLLDPEKIGFLIDLHNKKPEAIAKLIQESGIDAYELDEDKANAYEATPINIPSEAAQRLKEVVQDHKDNEDFNVVFSEASTWDDKSQQELLANPEYLAILAQHKTNGAYDKVMAEVNYLVNVKENKTPIIELYHAVGVQMFGKGNAQAPAVTKETTKSKPTKVTKRVDPLLEQKRKAMRGNRTTTDTRVTRNTAKTVEDIYSLSEEEFAKIDPNLLMPNT